MKTGAVVIKLHLFFVSKHTKGSDIYSVGSIKRHPMRRQYIAHSLACKRQTSHNTNLAKFTLDFIGCLPYNLIAVM